ncbi:MAG: LCP family protein [Leucobacter sp.]|jgi:LCP family protein required for cell wall assembly|nr:LCP family protein [Leucobacter sp.]
MSAALDLERPLRNPDTSSRPLMTKRARWLVLLGFVLPGSAQLLAGNRRLGRFGLTATVVLIVGVVLAAVGFSTQRELMLSIFTNTFVLLAVQVLLVAYAVLWVVLGLDTLRLTRLVKVSGKWRLPVVLLSLLLTFGPVLGAGWAATTVGSARGAISDIFGGGAPSVEPVDGRYNILLLGADAGEDRDGIRPDSISLVSVNAETGQSVIIGLPRELIEMPFPETSPMYAVHPNGFGVAPNAFDEDWDSCLTTCYLNALFTEVEVLGDPVYEGFYADSFARGSSPGIEATKDAVSGATGLTVQFYVLIDMHGFAALIDALGGVTVDVKEPVPVGGREDEDTGEWVDVAWYIEPGVQTLNGENAQWYARSRHGSDRGDYDRMDRQRELQAAILAQMSPANVLLRFQEVAAAGTDLVATDIPESMLGTFVGLAGKAQQFSPVMVQLTPPAVDPEYPIYSQILQLVAAGVAEASPVPEPDESAE